MVTTGPADIIADMGTITLAARALLVVVFAIAAVTKLANPAASRTTFRDFGAGARLARLAVLLAPVEMAVVVGLVFVPTARWSAAAASLLLLIFICGVLNALRLGRRPNCGCFGGFRPRPVGGSTLIRNGVLVAFCGAIVAFGPGPAVDHWWGSHNAGQIALLGIAILGSAAALIFGDAMISRAAAEGRASRASGPVGPSIGDPAPEFRTSDIDGRPQTLLSLRAPGEPVVLVFASPDCGSCVSVLSQLARWQVTMTGRLRITVVGSGSATQAILVREQYGLASVLLDDNRDISQEYGVHVTPTAFAISPEGLITSGPAIGYDAVEDLIRLTLHRGEPMLGRWDRSISAA